MIIKVPLQLSGSSEMDVDGTTPKVFSHTADQPMKLISIRITLIDEGASDFTKFGVLSTLSNGILIQTVIGGVTTTLATLKDNGDVVGFCDDAYFGSGSVLSLLGISTPQGFLNANDIFIGNADFSGDARVDIILNNGDIIKAIVQDNITALDAFRIYVKLGY